MKFSSIVALAIVAPVATSQPSPCTPKSLEYAEGIAMEVEKVGSIPVDTTAAFSYNLQPMDNFDGSTIFFLDQQFGRAYSYNQDTNETSSAFDMTSSDLPAGVTLDWDLGSAGQTYKVKSMTRGDLADEVILVMTSSTLPTGWDKADATLPAEGAYSKWVCGPDDHYFFRDIYRPGVVPNCSDNGAGLEPFTGYDVFAKYTLAGGKLTSPSPFFVAESYVGPGHLGGGIAYVDSGRILYSVGDCTHFGLDGAFAPQIDSEHCGKIMLIETNKQGKYKVVAKGVRNPQQMRVFLSGKKLMLGFMDIGAVTAEEVNAFPLKMILNTRKIQNFGWGRNQKDGKAREGTFYVGPGNALKFGSNPPCEESAPIREHGFIQPWIQFGRTATDFYFAISSFAVPTGGVDKLKLIWTEFNTGTLLGTNKRAKWGRNYKRPATSYKIKVYDADGNYLENGFNDLVKEELGEVGYYRGDPRLFHYPDGRAGVFIERTGVFYKLKEIEIP